MGSYHDAAASNAITPGHPKYYSFEDYEAGAQQPDGHDVADMVDAGWTWEQVLTFIKRQVRPWEPPPETETAPMADGDRENDHAPETASIGNEHGEPRGGHSGPADAIAATGMPTPGDTAPQEEFKRHSVPDAKKAGGRGQRHSAGNEDKSDGDGKEEFFGRILPYADHMAIARRMVAELYARRDKGQRYPTLWRWRGAFYAWTGSYFRETAQEAINSVIWHYLDKAERYMKKGDVDPVPFIPTLKHIGGVGSALMAVCELSDETEAPSFVGNANLPVSSGLVAVSNGLLHLPTGRLYPPTPSFFNLHASDVAYDQRAPAPKEWFRFLNQVWPDDPQSIEALQEVFGYALSGDTLLQKIPLIVGPKRSGKGTIGRILTTLLGQASVVAPTLSGLSTPFGAEPLIGKSLALISDARLSGRADQAVIAERLLQVSGEDSVTIERKHRHSWTGKLGVRFVIMSNELPRLSDASGALAGRFVVLVMKNSFYGQEDPKLLQRLLPELPGILNWARDGYLRLNERGRFVVPDSAAEAVAELEALGSPVKAFLRDCCEVAPGGQCKVSELYEAWKAWCHENGRDRPGTTHTFGKDLSAAAPSLRVIRPRMEGGRERVYEGIRLLRDEPTYSDYGVDRLARRFKA